VYEHGIDQGISKNSIKEARKQIVPLYTLCTSHFVYDANY